MPCHITLQSSKYINMKLIHTLTKLKSDQNIEPDNSIIHVDHWKLKCFKEMDVQFSNYEILYESLSISLSSHYIADKKMFTEKRENYTMSELNYLT